jgi:hypothetical protein
MLPVYLESGCSSDDGASGVMRPLASAAVQGEGTEAWCSREGGGNGDGVSRSLPARTLMNAMWSQHATSSWPRCHIWVPAATSELAGVGVAPEDGPGYSDRMPNSTTFPSMEKDGKLRGSVCTQHWSSASHTFRTWEHVTVSLHLILRRNVPYSSSYLPSSFSSSS